MFGEVLTKADLSGRLIKKKRSCRAKLSSSSKRFSSQVARFTSLKLFACGEASLSRNYVSSSYERILDRAAPTFTFFRRVYAWPSMLVSSNFLEQKSSFSPLISFRRVRVMEISRCSVARFNKKFHASSCYPRDVTCS